MTASLRFCLALHNHQPVGNFDDVIEQAVEESYQPFLDVFERYESLRLSLHVSGSLMMWLQRRRPDYVERLRQLVEADRIEMLGGALYEPILSMIPSSHRVRQIQKYSAWLHRHLGCEVQGMWIPERVWEPGLVSDLVRAGIRYTILDDFHFRCAGLGDEQLHGHYLTEDQGSVVGVFPGSEQLRYLIPFRQPGETLDYLRYIAELHPGTTVVFADDGEKFGTWPGTRQHVYEDGWLNRFFDTLADQADWLECTTLSTALDATPPCGKAFLPAASYREMTEWALPVKQQQQYAQLVADMKTDDRWQTLRQFLHGGFWRNFRVRYAEADEMYARMMHVAGRLERAGAGDSPPDWFDEAEELLFRSQCNCPWWHGAFGGIYLPHLRNAVYQNLIRADSLIDQVSGNDHDCLAIEADDFNQDRYQEVRIANRHLIGWLAPARGGHLYELDVRAVGHNLLATMQRREEAYHSRVQQGDRLESGPAGSAASIHEQVVFKQPGLDQKLLYDTHPRKSLVDHFWPLDCSLAEMVDGTANELGDFVTGYFESTIRRGADRHQLLMTRTSQVAGREITLTKGVTLARDRGCLELAWLLEGLPAKAEFRFGTEFNFAGMPAGLDDRLLLDEDGQSLGSIGQSLVLENGHALTLSDAWLGLQARLAWDRPARLWTWPVETVSQSEGGFELIHQSTIVQPNWVVSGDTNGRWAVKMEFQLSTLARQDDPLTPGAPASHAPSGHDAAL